MFDDDPNEQRDRRENRILWITLGVFGAALIIQEGARAWAG